MTKFGTAVGVNAEKQLYIMHRHPELGPQIIALSKEEWDDILPDIDDTLHELWEEV